MMLWELMISVIFPPPKKIIAEYHEKMSDKLKLWNVVQNSYYVVKIIKIIKEPGMVAQAFSSGTQEPAWATS